jgi:hypothetical protein
MAVDSAAAVASPSSSGISPPPEAQAATVAHVSSAPSSVCQNFVRTYSRTVMIPRYILCPQ